MRFLLICIGGAIGTLARYLTTLWAASAFGLAFPAGTLIVNVTGSFLIALVMHVATTTAWIAPNVRLMLTTGVLGGFTTYSSFNYETTEYLRAGKLGVGVANLGLTVIGCLVAGVAGMLCGRWIAGR